MIEIPAIERHLVLPASPEQLWHALTDADAVSGWFGGRVEWDLQPGAAARFVEDDGARRQGVVEVVEVGRRLVFRWWPEGGEDQSSEVSYRLDPDDDGTRLTVTERAVPAEPTPPQGSAPAQACATSTGRAAPGTPTEWDRWSRWDSALLQVWAATLEPARV